MSNTIQPEPQGEQVPAVGLQRLVTPPPPYYSQDGITIYCADNRHVLPLLDEFDLLLTDPPYGIGEGNQKRILSRAHAAKATDYGHTDWDSNPPEPWMLQMAISKARWQIIWGGNYYGLPASSCWLVWDKQNSGDFADGEMAWTNLRQAMRIKAHLWNGMIRKNSEERFHPTQKPLDVMTWCLGQVPDAKTVLDPWMGSGTTLVAAKLRGLEAVGIEINEQYCEAAKQRLYQGVLLAV